MTVSQRASTSSRIDDEISHEDGPVGLGFTLSDRLGRNYLAALRKKWGGLELGKTEQTEVPHVILRSCARLDDLIPRQGQATVEPGTLGWLMRSDKPA